MTPVTSIREHQMWGTELGASQTHRGKHMRRMTKGIAPLVALALVAAACGGDDDDGSE